MKHLLILLSIVVFFVILIFCLDRCKNPTYKEYEKIELHEEDSLVNIKYEEISASKDSILKLADEAMKQLEIRKNKRKEMVNQIKKQIENEELTKHQIEDLQKQSQIYEDQNQVYQQQIEEISATQVIEKDSVIYNVQYVDTQIRKPVYIPDTIIVEVLDTVIVKKLNKKRNKKKNR